MSKPTAAPVRPDADEAPVTPEVEGALVASLNRLRANINARNEVNRGNAVTAASLWNRLNLRETMTGADELNVLGRWALSSPELRGGRRLEHYDREVHHRLDELSWSMVSNCGE